MTNARMRLASKYKANLPIKIVNQKEIPKRPGLLEQVEGIFEGETKFTKVLRGEKRVKWHLKHKNFKSC